MLNIMGRGTNSNPSKFAWLYDEKRRFWGTVYNLWNMSICLQRMPPTPSNNPHLSHIWQLYLLKHRNFTGPNYPALELPRPPSTPSLLLCAPMVNPVACEEGIEFKSRGDDGNNVIERATEVQSHFEKKVSAYAYRAYIRPLEHYGQAKRQQDLVIARLQSKEAEQYEVLLKLTYELNESNNSQENLRTQLSERDYEIEILESTISELGNKKSRNLEDNLHQLSVQDVDSLQNSFKLIYKLLLNDFEQSGLGVEDGHDLHFILRPGMNMYNKESENPTILAECVVSAFRTALDKRKQQIHHLQANIEFTKGQLLASICNVKSLEAGLNEAKAKFSKQIEANKQIQDTFEKLKEESDADAASENKLLKAQLNKLTIDYEEVCLQLEESQDALHKYKNDADAEVLKEKVVFETEKAEEIQKEKKKWVEEARQANKSKDKIELELHNSKRDLQNLRNELLESERQRSELGTEIIKLISQANASDDTRNILEKQCDSQRKDYLKEIMLHTKSNELIKEELALTKKELAEAVQVLEQKKVELKNVGKLHGESAQLATSKEITIKSLLNLINTMEQESILTEEIKETMKNNLLGKDTTIYALETELNETGYKMITKISKLNVELARTKSELKNEKNRSEQEKAKLQSMFTKQIATIESDRDVNQDKIKLEYNEKFKNLCHDLEIKNTNEVNQLNVEINYLEKQIESQALQYRETIVRAEQETQKSLSLAQQQNKVLSDKIRFLEREQQLELTLIKQARDTEIERAQDEKHQAECLLEAQEKNYREQIQILEKHVTSLQEQLSKEMWRRQSFLKRSFHTGQEIRSLRLALENSLCNVFMDSSERIIEN